MNGFSSIRTTSVEEKGERRWSIHFSVPLSSPYYREHFEAFHLLPAVAEIDIAVLEAGRLLDRSLSVIKIRKTKFTRPILPDVAMVLTLDASREGVVSFSYADEEGSSYSSGNLEVR